MMAAFIIGALPFSYWLGCLVLRQDIRTVGDRNPGAVNVFRSGGRGWGWVALCLDYAKGFLPVLWWQTHAGGLLEVHPLLTVGTALAPVVGHAFSPFLLGRGGKAVTVTFGIWSGLTLWVVPVVMGIALALGHVALRLRPHGWTVLLGLLAIPPTLLVLQAPNELWWVWLGNTAVVIFKHRDDLRQRPHWAGLATSRRDGR